MRLHDVFSLSFPIPSLGLSRACNCARKQESGAKEQGMGKGVTKARGGAWDSKEGNLEPSRVGVNIQPPRKDFRICFHW